MSVRERVAGAVIGIVFGVTLSWTGMSSPDVLRDGLLFRSAYLFLFFGAAVITSFAGLRLLRRLRPRALLTGERVHWSPETVKRRQLSGSVIFGIGWAVADACPGPIATQLGQGVAWSLFTIAGVATGIWLALRRDRVQARAGVSAAVAAPAAGD
jgi:uncharacterized membrane protein YedE/YeeE